MSDRVPKISYERASHRSRWLAVLTAVNSTFTPWNTKTYASYRPEGSMEPQYEDLYKALQSNDHVQQLTAHVSLPTIPYGRKYGSALTPTLCDPISERPYDIELTRISHGARSVTRYNSDVSRAGKMPGVSGKTGVAAAAAGDNGVLESSGDFNLSRVWVKRDTDGRLSEGYMRCLCHGNGSADSVVHLQNALT
ncbi:hypothetical protein C8J55DRAFT_491629 [Lentinula edodes]|uniref:Uncharacterized protein n=1 Tax=Lentinula lateritia TaxID=40482 RepID=A0A9W8ZZU8_9AGAR|nr:hypothetical protein C8J55DRAFT_491629 [Lentinula edodes]